MRSTHKTTITDYYTLLPLSTSHFDSKLCFLLCFFFYLFACDRSYRLLTMSLSATSPAVGSFYLSRSTRSMPRFRMAVRSGAVSVNPILTKLQKDCATPLPVLRHVADAMAADMRSGLASDSGSDLKMILTYVDSLPSGYV